MFTSTAAVNSYLQQVHGFLTTGLLWLQSLHLFQIRTKAQYFNRYSVSGVLQAAESGNVEDFGRLYLAEPGRLGVRDSRGRAAAHQAAARNKVNILQFIAAHGGGMTVTNSVVYVYA